MHHKVVHTIAVLCFLSACTIAQVHRTEPSIEERLRPLEPLIIEASKRYGIDPRVLRIVCFVESRYRPDAVSPKGARGLMQFMPETAARYGLQNPHDPKAALDAAARYLRDLLKRFSGRVDLAVAAYNAGEGAVESFLTGRPLVLRSGKIINPRGLVTGGIPPYAETQAYVKRIVESLATSRTSSRRIVSANLNSFPGTKSRDFTLDVTNTATIEKTQTLNFFIEVK